MTQIGIELILTAEILYRTCAMKRYQRRVERKAELEQKDQMRILAAERAEEERLERVEHLGIDRLLKDAAAFRQAAEIRHYVEAIRGTGSLATCSAEAERWCQWALEQADRIDPIHIWRFPQDKLRTRD